VHHNATDVIVGVAKKTNNTGLKILKLLLNTWMSKKLNYEYQKTELSA